MISINKYGLGLGYYKPRPKIRTESLQPIPEPTPEIDSPKTRPELTEIKPYSN